MDGVQPGLVLLQLRSVLQPVFHSLKPLLLFPEDIVLFVYLLLFQGLLDSQVFALLELAVWVVGGFEVGLLFEQLLCIEFVKFFLLPFMLQLSLPLFHLMFVVTGYYEIVPKRHISHMLPLLSLYPICQSGRTRPKLVSYTLPRQSFNGSCNRRLFFNQIFIRMFRNCVFKVLKQILSGRPDNLHRGHGAHTPTLSASHSVGHPALFLSWCGWARLF